MIISAMPLSDIGQILSGKQVQIAALPIEKSFLSELEAVLKTGDIAPDPDNISESLEVKSQPIIAENISVDTLELDPEKAKAQKDQKEEALPSSEDQSVPEYQAPFNVIKHIQQPEPVPFVADDTQKTNAIDTKKIQPSLNETTLNILPLEKPISIVPKLTGGIAEQHLSNVTEGVASEQVSSEPPMPVIKLESPSIVSVTNFTSPSSLTRTLNLTNEAQWINQLSAQITKLAEGKDKIQFQLNPVHLGKLKVEIIQSINGDTIKMETQTEEARQIIVLSQGRLEQDIRQAGSRITSVDVLADPNGFAEQSNGRNNSQSGSNIYQNSQKQIANSADDQAVIQPRNTPTQKAPSHSERYA